MKLTDVRTIKYLHPCIIRSARSELQSRYPWKVLSTAEKRKWTQIHHHITNLCCHPYLHGPRKLLLFALGCFIVRQLFFSTFKRTALIYFHWWGCRRRSWYWRYSTLFILLDKDWTIDRIEKLPKTIMKDQRLFNIASMRCIINCQHFTRWNLLQKFYCWLELDIILTMND